MKKLSAEEFEEKFNEWLKERIKLKTPFGTIGASNLTILKVLEIVLGGVLVLQILARWDCF